MNNQPNYCEARQYSDQMHCNKCDLIWDMNDDDPPPCRSSPPGTARRTAMDRISKTLASVVCAVALTGCYEAGDCVERADGKRGVWVRDGGSMFMVVRWGGFEHDSKVERYWIRECTE